MNTFSELKYTTKNETHGINCVKQIHLISTNTDVILNNKLFDIISWCPIDWEVNATRLKTKCYAQVVTLYISRNIFL